MYDFDSITDHAERIAEALKATGKMPRAKVWTNGKVVRVYTGMGSEFITVLDSGAVEKCRLNMQWGQLIDCNALAALR